VRFAITVALAAGLHPTFASDFHDVPVHIEPPQRITALVLEINGRNVPVAVADGKARIPADLPLPWKVAQLRFEPAVYTQADLIAQRPLLLRELGKLAGVIREGGHQINHPFTLLLRPSGGKDVGERTFSPAAESGGAFETSLPAGTYQIAIVSDSCATRLRSGLVVTPGARLDLGTLSCEPTLPVSFRVTDGKTGAPIAGAKVVWDPAGALNAEDAKVMFARTWSDSTDRRGGVVFRVGPIPIPVRWRVEAPGYAVERTRLTPLFSAKDATLADVHLRPSAALHVHVHLPEAGHDFDGGSIVLAEPEEQVPSHYRPRLRQQLHDGEITFPIETFGPKRVSIENGTGKKLCYQDINVQPESSVLELSPQPIVIHGRVSRGDVGIEKATVILSDPHDGRTILAKAVADTAGAYSLTTYQSGDLSLYATKYGARYATMGAVFRKLHTTPDHRDYPLDFESPGGGITVVVSDAQSHQPLRASVKAGFKLKQDGSLAGMLGETDDTGKVTFEGFAAGSASLDVSAPGYRTRQVDVPVRGDAVDEHEVTLSRSQPIKGRVVSPGGAAISGAVITASYDVLTEMMPRFQTATDGSGKFGFDSPPDPGTTFYVVAAGWALATVIFEPGADNVVTLYPPSPNTVLVLEKDESPPKHPYRISAAAAGSDYIPSGVLNDLAEANGMNAFQLLGTGKDGTLVLPQFLAPGSYDFFLTHRAQNSPNGLSYERLGTLTLPGQRVAVMHISK
jgi:hypothetical protein